MATTSPPALTTTFTPAPSCLRDTYVWNATVGKSCGSGSSTVPCVYASLGPPSTSACLPSGYNWDTTAYFSPGICPSGYMIACSSVVSIGSVSETRATCCPVYVWKLLQHGVYIALTGLLFLQRILLPVRDSMALVFD